MDDGPANPFGNGFVAVETPLTKESQAQRVCNPQTARYWKIANPSSKHPVTGETAVLSKDCTWPLPRY